MVLYETIIQSQVAYPGVFSSIHFTECVTEEYIEYTLSPTSERHVNVLTWSAVTEKVQIIQFKQLHEL